MGIGCDKGTLDDIETNDKKNSSALFKYLYIEQCDREQ
jgi:hypothetical protein